MDHVAGRGEETTHGFSAVDLLEVVDNGSTAPGVATFATEFHERKFCVCVFRKRCPNLLSVCSFIFSQEDLQNIEIKVC